MAIYGLQVDFMNKLLREYFGLENPTLKENEIYVGLGLTQFGAHINTEDFTEVFDGRPLGNYKRARAIFCRAEDTVIYNENEILFNTPTENWTDASRQIEMIGIFDRLDYEHENGELVKPLIVLKLPNPETALKGETLMLTPGAIKLSLTDI